MEQEIWKNIDFIDTKYEYQVSNLGHFRRWLISSKRWKTIKGTIGRKGYVYVRLTIDDYKSKSYFAHRLVALAFIPNENNYPQINHKDENKTNNCVDNLEWCTNDYNFNYGTRRQRASASLSKRQTGMKYSQSRCINMSKANQKYKIKQMDLYGNVIKIYDSLLIASLETGIPRGNIQTCLYKYSKTSGGFKWEFVS